MGGCVSTADRAGKARSDEIDRQIEEDNRRFKRECKILLLGEWPSLSFLLAFLRFEVGLGLLTPAFIEPQGDS